MKKINEFEGIKEPGSIELFYLTIRRYIREGYWSIRNFFFPKQRWIKKYIRYYNWCDKDALIQDFNFAMIVHFVEEEKCFEKIDWDSEEKEKEVAAFIKKCYRYITYQRPRLLNIKEKKTNEFIEQSDIKNKRKKMVSYQKITVLIDDKDLYYLQGIMKYRRYLWT